MSKNMLEFSKNQKARYQILRHLIIGGSGVCFNYTATLFFVTYLALNIFLAVTIIHTLLIIYIFFMQKNFTFLSEGKKSLLFIRFIVFSLAYYLIDFSATTYLINSLNLDLWLAKIILLTAITPLSFVIQRTHIFNAK